MLENLCDPLKSSDPQFDEAAGYIQKFTDFGARVLSASVSLNIDAFFADYLPSKANETFL